MIAQTLEPRCPALEAEDRCFQKLEVCDIADLDALFGRGAECTPLGMRPFSATVRVLRTPLLFVGEVRSRSAYQVRRQVEAGRMCLAYADSKPGFSVRPRSSLCRADIVVEGEGSLDVRMRGPSQLVWIEANVSAFPQLPALVPPAGDVAVVRPTEPALSTGLSAYVAALLAMCAADRALLEDHALRARIENDLVTRMARALTWSVATPPPSKRERKMDELARREATGGLRIIDVAADFGFWHMGHFGSDYRRTFGTTASQTLARARG